MGKLESKRGFKVFIRAVGDVLAADHGRSLADAVCAGAHAEYDRALEETPDIGGLRNVFQPVMTLNTWLIALFRAMKAQALNAETTIRASH
ncbi:MAG: hypothetical protein ACI8TX_001912 [Hyphomicrobiaceae bacterium]|jgi:hypothetical protein